MNRPNFFIVGAPKCGTTAWHEYLSTHPDIAFSRGKEPHHFNTDMPGFRWAQSEAGYLDLFKDAGGAKVIGEASVQYLASRAAAANIAEFAPDARILVFLRGPVAFLKSYHNQLLLNMDETIEDFAEAWQASADIGSRKLPDGCRDRLLLDYRNAASFGAQLQRYLGHFQPEQVMVLDIADWSGNPRDTYLRILKFLGLPDDGRQDFPRVHEGKSVASARVAKLTQRPPAWVLWLARQVRRLTGRERLGLAHKMRQANYRKGYAKAPDGRADDEIRAFFAADQALLADLRTKVEKAHA